MSFRNVFTTPPEVYDASRPRDDDSEQIARRRTDVRESLARAGSRVEFSLLACLNVALLDVFTRFDVARTVFALAAGVSIAGVIVAYEDAAGVAQGLIEDGHAETFDVMAAYALQPEPGPQPPTSPSPE